jgi:hypothetical protein
MTDNSLSKIPHWDRNAESFGVYLSKIEAHAEIMGVGDVLNLVANCPTKSVDVTNPTNMPLVELYKANEKLCATIALGQGKSHGIALLGEMKNNDCPNGLAYELVARPRRQTANKPSDASAMIELEIELERL